MRCGGRTEYKDVSQSQGTQHSWLGRKFSELGAQRDQDLTIGFLFHISTDLLNMTRGCLSN